MKKKLSIIALCLVVVMCFTALVACDVSGIELDTPVVKINRNGLASWKAVDNAKSYVCNVSGREVETMYTIMQLKDGESISVKAVSGGSPYKNSKWSETKTYNASSGGNQGESGKIKLATPVVTISQSGLASWDSVANASEYEYTINGTAVGKTTHTNIQLEAGQTIFVKALGTGNYTDSDPSAIQKYEKPCEHVDADNDGKCDKCGKDTAINECDHIDANDDSVCDKCYRDLDVSCVHIDEDNNGKCDKCTAGVVVDFDIYAINDLHGMYVETNDQPGVDGLTTYFNKKKQDGNVIILASGDMWQGSSESNNTKGKLATEWLNYIGCSSMTLGNHEFDWKTDKIKTNAELAQFPFLAINVYERATNQRVAYCQSSVMVEKDGAKVGIIGAIGDCYSSISASMCKDVYFKVGSELTALIKAESQNLKKQGADYIVLSIHDGYENSSSYSQSISNRDMTWYDASLSNGYVDMVFEGHTHQSYMLVDSYGVNHLQAGGQNQGVSNAVAKINYANGKSTTSTKILANSTYENETHDGIIDALVEKYSSEIGNPDEIIGENGQYRNSYALRTAMASAYLRKGQSMWGSEYDIVLAGGSINARYPYYLPAGNVTIRQIQMLFPFDNEVQLCSIKGVDLLNRYFNNTKYYYARGNNADSVEARLRNGQDLNKTFYIVSDSWNSDYSINNLTVIKTLGDVCYPRDCLAEYIKAGLFK